MATLYDVARLAGVSTATVSRVVHGQDRVRESTRARVLEVIEQLGYVPDSAAQSLSRRRKDVIGLVYMDRSEAKQYEVENMGLLYYDELLRGVQARIRDDHRWSLLITCLYEDEAKDLPGLLSLTGKVDGLMVGEGIIAYALEPRVTARLPVVAVAGTPGRIDVVKADNYSGATALITHLVEAHHLRRLFHVDGPADVPDACERRLALEDVLATHPDSTLAGSYQGMFSVRSGVEAGETLLAHWDEVRPDAIACANDQTAMGMLQALAKAGVRVPQDVAVTGFDDIYPGALNDPPLTTVHQPMRLLGEHACGRLLDRIAKPSMRPKVELLPTELVLRSSCGCPPGTDTRLPVKPLTPARVMPATAKGRGGRHRPPPAPGHQELGHPRYPSNSRTCSPRPTRALEAMLGVGHPGSLWARRGLPLPPRPPWPPTTGTLTPPPRK
jgi:LacI family transcriptional regulator